MPDDRAILSTHTGSTTVNCRPANRWPKQRILFLLAGAFTFLGAILTATLSPWFLLIPALVGANQLLMVATGWCPVSLLLDRTLYR